MNQFGKSQVRTEQVKPISKGDNKHGYQVVKQKDGSDAIMSDKGIYYKDKKEGNLPTVLSMCNTETDCTLFDTVIQCKGFGIDMLRRWSVCNACNTER